VGQIPVFFGERPTGRRFERANKYTTQFLDLDNSPLYPFGHGLTYGRFVYGGLRVSPEEVGEGGLLTVSLRLVNEGDVAAEETVFFFTRDVVASVTQPLLVLRDFAKVTLMPGEAGEVRFVLRAADLAILGQDLRPVFEPGDVEVLVGPSADLGRLAAQTVRLV
jgi:beta-glucosidase